uniref:Uncharacterized protein n=1 Tax=viral metagenome TaxID=1070528 RepID=A0A6C0B510_9ZZZZ
MDTIYSILIFIVVLILYSQVIFQLKKGDDVEIYETDYTTNKDINANANLKQPFVFQFGEYDSNLKSMPLTKMVAEQGSFDVYVKEVADYHADRPPSSVVLSLSAANSLMKTDTEGKYFSSGNQYFIEETGIQRYYQQLDKYLEPALSVFSRYDLLLGSAGVTTPLSYHTFERRYIYITGGKYVVKMTPWRSTKYMALNKNYRDYEFSSPLNVWKPHDSGYSKMKFVDFNIEAGQVLYVPPFWHYSLKMVGTDADHVCHVFDYSSPMNILANAFSITNHLFEKYGPKAGPKENGKITTI